MDSLASAAMLPWLLILTAAAVAAAVALALFRRARLRTRDRETALLRDGLESLGHAFALFDDGGRLVRCNRRYRAAYPAIADLLVPGARIDRILAAAAVRGDRLAPGESLGDWVQARVDRRLADAEAEWHRLGDGRWYRISEFETGQGGVVKLLTDVTEERRRDAALAHARKMEAVGRLAAGLAHEFNNILTAVGGFAELARRSSAPGPVRDHLDSVIDGTGRAADLTRQLLDLSRPSEPHLEAVPIDAAIAQVEPMLRFLAGPKVAVTVDVEDPAPAVMADATALGHALINLTVNAADAMPEGGRLTVTARRRPIPDSDAGRFLALSVGDTGTGIPPELRERIFEPFFTTKPAGAGTGLGLALVEATVRQAGGHLEVDSVPGEGTTFTLLLPLAEQPATGREPPSSVPSAGAGPGGCEPSATGGPGRAAGPDGRAAGIGFGDGDGPGGPAEGISTILVVDDEAPIRDLVALTLEGLGYRVVRAADAAAALEAVSRQPVGLVLADVVLPDATGPQLAARLAEARPQLPIVFMSGIEPRRSADRRMVARGIPIIAKPFEEAMLTGTVSRILGPAPAKTTQDTPAPA